MKIAVLGCGNMGRRRLSALRAMGGHDLLAYDVHSGQLAYASGAFDVGLARQLPEVWDWQPDAVLICTPPDSHAELLREAHSHGVRAMFVEKPLSDKPIDVSPFADCVTMVGCNWRFHPGPMKIREWLNAERLGRVLTARLRVGYSIDEYPHYKESYVARTGVILDVGSHLLDLALNWFGPIESCGLVVLGGAGIDLPEMDAVAELLVHHRCQVVSAISINLIQRHYTHRVELVGREGEIGYDFVTEHIYSRLWGKPYEDLTWSGVPFPDMFESELTHFLACAREGNPTCNPFGQAIRTLNILLEGRRQWQEWQER